MKNEILFKCESCGSSLDNVVPVPTLNEEAKLTCPTCKAVMTLSAQLVEPGNSGGGAPGGEEPPMGEPPAEETPGEAGEETPGNEGGEIPDDLQIMPKGESKERGARLTEGLEKHIDGFLFNLGFNQVEIAQDRDVLIITISDNDWSGGMSLNSVADALAKEVLTRHARFRVVDGIAGDTTGVIRGRAPQYSESKERGARKRITESDASNTGIRRYGPGKFDTLIDSWLYQLSMDGADTIGDVSEMGIAFTALSNVTAEEVEKVAAEDRDALTAEEKAYLTENPFHILSENDQGFVTVDDYATKELFDEAWESCEAEIENMEGPADEREESKRGKKRGAQCPIKEGKYPPYYKSASDFVAFLQDTLIPDLRADGQKQTATDFEEAIYWLTGEGGAVNYNTAREYMEYLLTTLIPDLKEAGAVNTAQDFEEAIYWIRATKRRTESRGRKGKRIRESFMEREVIEGDWFVVDGSMGTDYIPADVVSTKRGHEVRDSITGDGSWEKETNSERYVWTPDDSHDDSIPPELRDFTQNRRGEIMFIHGWGAHLSAPGYLDQTEWAVFDTEKEAIAYLDEYYPEDEDEDKDVDKDEDDVTESRRLRESPAEEEGLLLAIQEWAGDDVTAEALRGVIFACASDEDIFQNLIDEVQSEWEATAQAHAEDDVDKADYTAQRSKYGMSSLPPRKLAGRGESRLHEDSDKKEWTGSLAGFSAKMLGIGVDLGLEPADIDELIARLTDKDAVEIKDDEIKVTFKKVKQIMVDFLKEKNPVAAAPAPAPEPAQDAPPAPSDVAPVGTPPPADAPAPDAIAEPPADLGTAVAKAGDAKPAGESRVSEALASPERIKKLAYRAAYDRVSGRINDAMRFEQAVDSLVMQMEKAGRGDEARDAEVAGQEAGQADAQSDRERDPQYELMAEADEKKDEAPDPAEQAEEEAEKKVDRLLSKYFESVRVTEASYCPKCKSRLFPDDLRFIETVGVCGDCTTRDDRLRQDFAVRMSTRVTQWKKDWTKWFRGGRKGLAPVRPDAV